LQGSQGISCDALFSALEGDGTEKILNDKEFDKRRGSKGEETETQAKNMLVRKKKELLRPEEGKKKPTLSRAPALRSPCGMESSKRRGAGPTSNGTRESAPPIKTLFCFNQRIEKRGGSGDFATRNVSGERE